MRLEATIPDSRANAVVKLADELGLSRSQIIDEARCTPTEPATASGGGA